MTVIVDGDEDATLPNGHAPLPEPSGLSKWLRSDVSVRLAAFVWLAVLAELAYATYYVRVINQSAPRLQIYGNSGCATICWSGEK